MATNDIISLDKLPVELLHRIFDNLDTETILFSLQYVCKRLHLITNNYNRYKLNFKSISKHKFDQICHATYPKNVISLILSNENQTPGQIELFLSLYHIEEYIRLQSVTLFSIEETYLKIILEHLSTTSTLTSLIVHCKSNSILNAEILLLFSLIIRKSSLRKLDLFLTYLTIDKLEWPDTCTIQYLNLFNCIPFNKFCTILHCSPYLKTMILRDCIIYGTDVLNSMISDKISYRQLSSLTLKDCDLDMTMIESLLSLTPSLIHLTLIIINNDRNLFDGFRWEQFIQIRLSNLNKFQFAFQSNIIISHDSIDLDSLIAPFQTSFWLETKQWFVTALCIKSLNLVNLYTIPDCAPKINFHPEAIKISRSTVPTILKDLITMDNARELTLDLLKMQVDMTEKKEISIRRVFNKLIKLTLRCDGDWPNDSLEFLSSLIDLSTITDLVLDVDFTRDTILNTIGDITSLLERTFNIQSLIINSQIPCLENIYSIISYRIQHLQITINCVEDAKLILERFNDLSSVMFKFPTDSLVHTKKIIQWLILRDRDFTYQSTQHSLSLWFGKSAKQSFYN